MRKLLNRFLSWFASIPGEDGYSNWTDDPCDLHDPERITRLQFEDDFRIFERHKEP